MTLTLILIRHCKSDWDGSTGDHARPLNPRGQRSAPRIGAWLAAQDIVPDHVLCSDAMRTKQTWAGIADHLPAKPEVTYSRALYLAEPEAMLAALHEAPGRAVAMIGHNPGIGALAWHLADASPADNRFAQYPTGATTILQFAAPGWQDIGHGNVMHFVTPRDLPDPD
ncbi:histidine phosphatase family protein [Hasllibacter sp. MH4015]|uniref:SixA phosphatase family protein n=1 Tax=Hasllibacter sp. MH4015 TaxID=2854029 RepID=UPI001CD6CD64|nr:histidine phosphatase family protein [Hasllibacter sp. MH4015]